MWCDYGGIAAEGLVATKRKNGGTEEEEQMHRRGRIVVAKKKEIFEGVVETERR